MFKKRNERWNNSNQYEISFRLKISLRCSVSFLLCSHELRRNETQNGMDLISVILTEMKFQTGMRFSCEQNLLETKWISANSLDTAFNAHVRFKLIQVWISYWSFWQKWNFISGGKTSCKHYLKWNAYTSSSKYWVVLECSRNETSCEQNLFSSRFEMSNRYEFILPLMWTCS